MHHWWRRRRGEGKVDGRAYRLRRMTGMAMRKEMRGAQMSLLRLLYDLAAPSCGRYQKSSS